MIVFLLSYVGGQQFVYNFILMLGLVKNYDYVVWLNESDFMGKIEEIMVGDDVMVLVYGYFVGGFVGKEKCIIFLEDVKG